MAFIYALFGALVALVVAGVWSWMEKEKNNWPDHR